MRLPIIATALGLATLALNFLGVGGYRAGWVWVVLVLSGGGGTLTWWLLGHDVPGRGTYATAVGVAALALVAVIVPRASLSKGRLEAELDALRLNFFSPVRTESSGHSWCDPTCPIVVRTYRAPDVGPKAVAGTVANAMAARRLVADPRLLRADPSDETGRTYRIRGHRLDATITSSRVPPRTNARGEVLEPGRSTVEVRVAGFRK